MFDPLPYATYLLRHVHHARPQQRLMLTAAGGQFRVPAHHSAHARHLAGCAVQLDRGLRRTRRACSRNGRRCETVLQWAGAVHLLLAGPRKLLRSGEVAHGKAPEPITLRRPQKKKGRFQFVNPKAWVSVVVRGVALSCRGTLGSCRRRRTSSA